jgi:hypothetical protein
MTIKRKPYLWIHPSLDGRRITLTGGTFQDYGIRRVIYKGLCTYIFITGNLYPFDPESRKRAVAYVEDRGRCTKANIWNHSPTFSTQKYTKISYFSMTQYIYTFDSDSYAKKVFENVLKAYEEQLKAYESMMIAYYTEKNERFKNRMMKKEKRKKMVDSNPEKASRRASELKKLSEKA